MLKTIIFVISYKNCSLLLYIKIIQIKVLDCYGNFQIYNENISMRFWSPMIFPCVGDWTTSKTYNKRKYKTMDEISNKLGISINYRCSAIILIMTINL